MASGPVPGNKRSCCGLNERSPRGITAEAGEPYLGHTLARVARSSYLFKRSRELFASSDMAHRRSLRAIPDGKTPTRGRVVAGLSFGFWRACSIASTTNCGIPIYTEHSHTARETAQSLRA
jgi:hypothetical protein